MSAKRKTSVLLRSSAHVVFDAPPESVVENYKLILEGKTTTIGLLWDFDTGTLWELGPGCLVQVSDIAAIIPNGSGP